MFSDAIFYALYYAWLRFRNLIFFLNTFLWIACRLLFHIFLNRIFIYNLFLKILFLNTFLQFLKYHRKIPKFILVPKNLLISLTFLIIFHFSFEIKPKWVIRFSKDRICNFNPRRLIIILKRQIISPILGNLILLIFFPVFIKHVPIIILLLLIL